MKTKWSILWVVISLVLSVGIAAAQSNAASTSTNGQGTTASSRIRATLTGISVHSEKEGLSVEITCNRPVTPTPQMISDPSRLVLDFPDTISSNPKNRIDVNRDGLKSVRIGIQAADPPVTRVVLDMERSRAYKLVADGSKLTVKLGQEIEPSEASGTEKEDKPASPTAETATPISLTEKQSSAAEQDPALQPSPATKIPDTAPSVKASTPGQEANASAQPQPETGISHPAEAPQAALAPGSKQGDASSAATAGDPPAPDPVTTTQPSSDARVAASATLAGNNKSSNANRYEVATQIHNEPPPAHISSQAEAKPLPGADDPPPASPDTQPLRLASAVATPDLPAVTVAPSQPAAPSTPGEYVIGEQDVLSIVVWKERELSATVVVRPDGKITLPLVNEIKVIGMTPDHLQALLVDKFKPFLNIPQVTVEVVQINSRKAYLIGEVQKTGTFPLNSSTTVLQIIAAAGGLRDFAKRKDIYVLHNQNGKQVRYRFNYDEVIRGKNPQQNIVLQPGDMVVVP